MGALSDQMRALTEGIAASQDERLAAVAGIKSQAGDMLATFHREREAMGRNLKSGLAADCRGRVVGVMALRKEFCRDHARMGKEQGNRLATGRRVRSREVVALIGDFRRSRHKGARELASRLGMFVKTMAHQVTDLRAGFAVSAGAVRADVLAARQIWNNRLAGQASMATPAMLPTTTAEKSFVAGDAFRQFVSKRGKMKRP